MTAPTVPAGRLPWQLKFVALALIWGASFLLMMLGLRALAPMQVASTRIVAGTLILLVLLRVSGGHLPRGRRTWFHLFVSGFFLSTLPFILFAASEERITSALAGIANAVTPIAAVICALMLLPSDRLPPDKLVAVVVGFLGVVMLAQPWQSEGRPDLVGLGFALAAGACYGFGWTYNRRLLAGVDIGGLSQPTATLLMGSVQIVPCLLVWSWWSGRGAPWSLHSESAGTAVLAIAAVLVLGFVGTGFAYMIQFDVMRAAGATVSTTVTYLIPVVSVALGYAFLGERLAWPQLLGAAVILGSAIVIGRTHR